MEFSFSEILLVLGIAFVVLGPEDFARKAHKVGAMLRRFRAQFGNFRILAQEELLKKAALPKVEALTKIEKDLRDLRQSVRVGTSPAPQNASENPENTSETGIAKISQTAAVTENSAALQTALKSGLPLGTESPGPESAESRFISRTEAKMKKAAWVKSEEDLNHG